MKVVCDACQAKYQIPDERVAGRKLKIRCRKCGNAIVVRGEHASGEVQTISSIPPAETTREVEWHVSIDGEQHGPYQTDQMGSMLRAGQLAWDAFVWRESYGDWKAASDSDTLVRAVAASADDEPTATAQMPHPQDGAQASVYVADEDPTRMAQAPATEELQPVARVAFATRAATRSQPAIGGIAPALRGGASMAAAAGYNGPRAVSQPAYEARAVSDNAAALRGGASMSQPAAYNGPRAVSQPPAYPSYAQAAAAPAYASPLMTGERNEDSVLFSARNLALAAAPGTATMAPVAPSAQSGGYASGEGSGLIDIRALAALAQSQHAPAATRSNGGGSLPIENHVRSSDAVMRMANQTGAFAHLDSLAPIDRPSQTPNRMVPIAILAGSAMIATAAFAALYISRPQPVQPVAAAAVAEPSVGIAAPIVPAAAPEAAPAPEPAPVAKAEAPEPADEPADQPVATTSARSNKPAKTVSAKRAAAPVEHASARPSKPEPARAAKEAKQDKADANEGKDKKSPSIDDLLSGDAKPAKAEPAKAAPPPASTPDDDLLAGPAPAPKSTKSKSIDELLDDAVPAKGAAKPAASAASDVALPETPTRDQVGSAMRAVEPDVKACAEGQSVDSPTAQVVISVAGATGRVSSVRVTGIQGNVGSCIARAVRAATFPKFAKAQLSINFPFKLK